MTTLQQVMAAAQAGESETLEFKRSAGVTVGFAPARYVPPQRVAHDLTERQRAVLAFLEASRGGLALREIRGRMAGQATEWEVRGDLQLLRHLGMAESRGHGRGAVWCFLQK